MGIKMMIIFVQIFYEWSIVRSSFLQPHMCFFISMLVVLPVCSMYIPSHPSQATRYITQYFYFFVIGCFPMLKNFTLSLFDTITKFKSVFLHSSNIVYLRCSISGITVYVVLFRDVGLFKLFCIVICSNLFLICFYNSFEWYLLFRSVFFTNFKLLFQNTGSAILIALFGTN